MEIRKSKNDMVLHSAERVEGTGQGLERSKSFGYELGLLERLHGCPCSQRIRGTKSSYVFEAPDAVRALHSNKFITSSELQVAEKISGMKKGVENQRLNDSMEYKLSS